MGGFFTGAGFDIIPLCYLKILNIGNREEGNVKVNAEEGENHYVHYPPGDDLALLSNARHRAKRQRAQGTLGSGACRARPVPAVHPLSILLVLPRRLVSRGRFVGCGARASNSLKPPP